MGPRKLSRVYDRVACVYDELRSVWVGHDAERALDTLVAEHVTPSSRVLDLGAGTGANLRRLVKHAPGFASYLGVDNSRKMIERAARNSAGDSRVAWKTADLTKPLNLNGSYDFIMCSWLLSHLEKPEDTANRSLDYLSPGGTAAFVFFSIPDNRLRAYLTAPFMWIVQCSRIDPVAFKSMPQLQGIMSFQHGASAMVLMRRP